MKTKNLLTMAVLAFMAFTTANAQEDTRDALRSYSYVEAQGGLNWTTTNAKITKLLMPQGALSFGHYFTPVVGARLHVSGLQAKSRFESAYYNLDYKWNYVTTSADLLVNLTTLVTKNYQNPLNLIFVGGLGLNYAWDNDELMNMRAPAEVVPLAWDDNRLSHNLRAGLRLETDVTKPLGVSLEVAANSLDDRFNSKTNDKDDWMITAMVGIAYRFGKRYQKPAPVMAPVVQEIVEDHSADLAPATPVVEEKKPEPKPQPKAVVKKETLHENIFYVICMSDPEDQGKPQLQRVADFMKKYKDAKVSIVGYADKGTGNPEINVMYAERRAAQCKDALVNKYGCDASRISIDSKGDTVQPFAENDKNRCVIIDSEAQYTVYE